MRIRAPIVFAFLAVVFLGMGLQNASGQALTGTLTGIVMDKSQAVVPTADIVMKDELSGVLRRTVSNNEGYFTIAAVPTGTYTVTVEAKGFKRWERTGIVFNPGDKRHLPDIVLEIGPTTTEVTVTAAATPLAPVDSGEKSVVIGQNQLQNVSVVGRSAAEFIKILPGMSPIGANIQNRPGFSGEIIGINGNGDQGVKQSALGNYSANGTRAGAMDIVADGAHVSDPGCNCATPVNPNPDMIQEFKVLQSNYSPEHAKGPVVLNAISKAGGRDFHGQAYYYMRQWGWNSNEPQLRALGQPKPKSKFRFPGGNIGGPVLLPGSDFNRNRDKMFFFTGFEYFYQMIDSGILRTVVPTEAMRGGDFSDTEYLSRLPFGQASGQPSLPGVVDGVIPPSMIDPGGQVLVNLIPLPNVNPSPATQGQNYVNALMQKQPNWQWLTRVDYSISDYTKLFVRYNLQRERQEFPVTLWWRNAGGVPYPTPVVGDNVSQSVSASLTRVFSPTLTNEVIFGLTYQNYPNRFEDPNKVSITALGYPYQGIYKWGNEQIPNYTAWAGDAATLYQPGGFDPVLFAKKWLVSGANNLTKVAGTHTLKFGAFYEIVTNNQPGSDSYATIDYSRWGGGSGQTGNAYANLLTGWANGYGEANKNALLNMGFRTLEFYAQDSWKATRRVTLEYGMRFAHLGAWYDREGFGYPIFNLAKYDETADVAALSGVEWNKINSSVPLSGAKTRPLFFSPRVGAAIDLFGTGMTVLRGGFGMFRYHDPQLNSGALSVPQGHKSTGAPTSMYLRDIENLTPSYSRTSINVMDPNDDQQPLTMNWNVTVSQRLPAQTMWEISYVGNKSKYLTNDGYGNINLVPLGALFAAADPDTAPVDDYRPLQSYLDITILQHNVYQNYHALQTTIQRQTGRVNWAANYTWSKTMGIRGGGQGNRGDQFNFENNYGPLPYDRTHMFNVSYVLQLPDLAKNVSGAGAGFLRALVDGWQFSGISQFASGPPLQAININSNFGLGGFLRNPDGSLVVNANGDPIGINNKNWLGTTANDLMPAVTCDPRAGLQDRQYLNPNCFALPEGGIITNRGVNGDYILPYTRGPAYLNNDLSLFKTFTLKEDKKLQFRFSAYNFLNHPLWTFNPDDPNLVLSFDEDGKLRNSRFGFTDNKVGHRVLQVALKFFF